MWFIEKVDSNDLIVIVLNNLFSIIFLYGFLFYINKLLKIHQLNITENTKISKKACERCQDFSGEKNPQKNNIIVENNIKSPKRWKKLVEYTKKYYEI